MAGAVPGLTRSKRRSHILGVNSSPETSVSDSLHPLQVWAWREVGGSGRSELAAELRRMACGWKQDALHAQHPT